MKMFIFAGNFRTLEFHVTTREVDEHITLKERRKIYTEELSGIADLVLAGDSWEFLSCAQFVECDMDLYEACKRFVEVMYEDRALYIEIYGNSICRNLISA